MAEIPPAQDLALLANWGWRGRWGGWSRVGDFRAEPGPALREITSLGETAGKS